MAIVFAAALLVLQGVRDYPLLYGAPPSVPSNAPKATVAAVSMPLEELLALNMLGRMPAELEVSAKPPPDEIPETRLDLVLKGVFASDNTALAGALIAEGRGGDRYYLVGDEIPGGARLAEIYPDSVALKRGEALELLRLTENAGAERVAASQPDGRPAVSPAPPGRRESRAMAANDARVKRLQERLKSLREQQN